MTKRNLATQLVAAIALALAACGGTAAPSSVPPAASVAASKPAAASVAASASASAAASKPAASAAASPTATLVPRVEADTTVVQPTNYAIPGTEGKTSQADIIDVDQAGHLLIIGDTASGGVDEFDVSTATAKFLRTVKTPSAPSGVVVAKNVNRIVAGLADSSVVSIDLTTNQIVGTLNTGGKKRADELDYDPKDKKVYIGNSDDGFVSAIDMTSFKVTKKFDGLGDAIEQPRYSPADGLMYVTLSGSDLIAQFDPAKDELVKKIETSKDCRPSGIGINPKTNVGVVSCRPQPMVMDFNTGKMTGGLERSARGDEIFYDAKTDLYFIGAASAPFGPSMSIVGGTPVRFITNIPSDRRGHNAGFDDTNNVIYSTGADGLLAFPLPAKVLAAASAAPAPAGSAAAKPAASGAPKPAA